MFLRIGSIGGFNDKARGQNHGLYN